MTGKVTNSFLSQKVTDGGIQAGEHRFRYWVDGHWFTDFAAYGVELTKFGWNSVLLVPEMMRSMRIMPEVEQQTELKTAA
jgi:hypothetical protein